MKRSLALVLVLAACGGDDGGGGGGKNDAAVTPGDGKAIDAAKPVDAGVDAQAFVVTVACDGSEVGTITTSGFAYSPSSLTINQNDVVKFVMISGMNHNVVPNSTGSDPGLQVDFGETACLQFTATGTFGFRCGPHNFMGSITVQ